MNAVSPHKALVLADDLGVFLAVARSLGRKGVEVDVAAADGEDAPGLVSSHVRRVRLLPAYAASPEGWARALAGMIEAESYRFVFPCCDSDLLRLAAHVRALEAGRLALPNEAAFAAFTDKRRTRALAGRLGIAIAEGEVVGPETSAAGLAERLGLPLVLKPASPYRPGDRRAKTFARIVRTRDELERALAGCRPGEWLAESWFEGDGVGVSVLAEHGRILLACQHRRLRTLSETGGGSVRITEEVDPALLADTARLAEATDLDGVAMFEFRRHRSRHHILIEVNPRFWGSLPLAVAAGADFPALLWATKTGETPRPEARVRSGIVRRNLTGEYERLAGENPAGLPALLATLPFAWRFDSWAPDDPAPWRRECRDLLLRLASAARSRLTLRRLAPATPPAI